MKPLVVMLALTAAVLASDAPKADARFFDKRVAPILTKRCLGCHNIDLKAGNISFEDRESLLKSGARGAAIVPGRPQESVMVQALTHTGDVRMPPGPKLPSKEIAILTEWVRRGARWGTKLRAAK